MLNFFCKKVLSNVLKALQLVDLLNIICYYENAFLQMFFCRTFVKIDRNLYKYRYIYSIQMTISNSNL